MQCKICYNQISESQIAKNLYRTKKKQQTYICKDCHSEKSRNYAMMKRANLRPDRHMDCNDCDRTFSKYSHGECKGKSGFFVKGTIRNKCPFCSSENIDTYI